MKTTTQENLLYKQNLKFISGAYTAPVNEKEILANFRYKNHTSTLPIVNRLLKSTGWIITSFIFAWFIFITIQFSTQAKIETGTWIPIINGGMLVIGSVVVVYICIRNAYYLTFSNMKSIELKYDKLISEGQVGKRRID